MRDGRSVGHSQIVPGPGTDHSHEIRRLSGFAGGATAGPAPATTPSGGVSAHAGVTIDE
jgi:hypothetical protein